MCDYSLQNVTSRPAKVGDELVTTEFRNSITCGFSAVGEPEVAVCLLPGTEITFAKEAEYRSRLMRLFSKMSGKVARFRQINMDNPQTHHDALEFADGKVVLVTLLRPGQRATVLQLPVLKSTPAASGEKAARPRLTAETRNHHGTTAGALPPVS